MTIPFWHTDWPSTSCPPPRTAISSALRRANSMARATSETSAQRTIIAGRISVRGLKLATRRALSKPGSRGAITRPFTDERNLARAASLMSALASFGPMSPSRRGDGRSVIPAPTAAALVMNWRRVNIRITAAGRNASAESSSSAPSFTRAARPGSLRRPADAKSRLGHGAHSMTSFHVCAAMRAVLVIPFHVAAAKRAAVAFAREVVEPQRRRHDRQEAENCLKHGWRSRDCSATTESASPGNRPNRRCRRCRVSSEPSTIAAQARAARVPLPTAARRRSGR